MLCAVGKLSVWGVQRHMIDITEWRHEHRETLPVPKPEGRMFRLSACLPIRDESRGDAARCRALLEEHPWSLLRGPALRIFDDAARREAPKPRPIPQVIFPVRSSVTPCSETRRAPEVPTVTAQEYMGKQRHRLARCGGEPNKILGARKMRE
jgi:hypothetical protein